MTFWAHETKLAFLISVLLWHFLMLVMYVHG